MIPCATCESLLCVGRIVSILEQLHEQKANQSVVIISFILYFLYGVVIGSGVKLIGSSPDPRFSFLVSGLCSMFILYYIENRPSLYFDISSAPVLRLPRLVPVPQTQAFVVILLEYQIRMCFIVLSPRKTRIQIHI